MKKYYLLCVMTFTAISSIFAQKQYTLTSPDENLQTNVYVGEKIEYQIQNKGKILYGSRKGIFQTAQPLLYVIHYGFYWKILR